MAQMRLCMFSISPADTTLSMTILCHVSDNRTCRAHIYRWSGPFPSTSGGCPGLLFLTSLSPQFCILGPWQRLLLHKKHTAWRKTTTFPSPVLDPWIYFQIVTDVNTWSSHAWLFLTSKLKTQPGDTQAVIPAPSKMTAGWATISSETFLTVFSLHKGYFIWNIFSMLVFSINFFFFFFGVLCPYVTVRDDLVQNKILRAHRDWNFTKLWTVLTGGLPVEPIELT